MANTALTNKVALASTGDKLKHWTQAIRDLYAELLDLKSGVVPMYHASPTRQYGIGDTFRYGHLRLLDKLLYQFKQNADGTWWTKSDLPIIQGVRWNAVTWHAGLFIAVGSNGRIAKSKDGKTWDDITWIESTTTTKDFELFDVQWCGSMFVAVGSFNSLVYSFDGAYWYTPMYVGSCYNSSGAIVNANTANLTQRPTGFKAKDAWKGIAYDNRTGVIFLCGTQCRTLTCRHVPLETLSTILFGETVFHFTGDERDAHVLNSAAAKELSGKTSFVAVGNYNVAVQGSVGWTSSNPIALDWPMKTAADGSRIRNSLMTIEDNVHTIANSTINESTGWNHVSLQKGANNEDVFVAIGTSGQSVMSIDGIGDSWTVPQYKDNTIQTNFQCQATGWNLTVAAGDWISTTASNITMYNDSVYADAENMEYGASVNTIQHFNTKVVETSSNGQVDNASWYGAAFGNLVFVIVGSDNRIYWHEIEEEDFSGAALSVLFYKQYIADLERRLAELEREIVINDMSFIEVKDTILNFLWTDPRAVMYQTSGSIKLNFIPAPQYIYKEMMIYLEAKNDTTLELTGAGEWENDLYEPEWGKQGSHMALKAIFIGSRVIVQIIDNDQLADNLALLDGDQSQP